MAKGNSIHSMDIHFINRICACNNNKGEFTSIIVCDRTISIHQRHHCVCSSIEQFGSAFRSSPTMTEHNNIEIAYLFVHKSHELATCRMCACCSSRISINTCVLLSRSFIPCKLDCLLVSTSWNCPTMYCIFIALPLAKWHIYSLMTIE